MATAEEGTLDAPLCIQKSPARVKEIHFLDTKGGCKVLDPGISAIEGTVLHLRRQVSLDYAVNYEGFPGDEGWNARRGDRDGATAWAGCSR